MMMQIVPTHLQYATSFLLTTNYQWYTVTSLDDDSILCRRPMILSEYTSKMERSVAQRSDLQASSSTNSAAHLESLPRPQKHSKEDLQTSSCERKWTWMKSGVGFKTTITNKSIRPNLLRLLSTPFLDSRVVKWTRYFVWKKLRTVWLEKTANNLSRTNSKRSKLRLKQSPNSLPVESIGPRLSWLPSTLFPNFGEVKCAASFGPKTSTKESIGRRMSWLPSTLSTRKGWVATTADVIAILSWMKIQRLGHSQSLVAVWANQSQCQEGSLHHSDSSAVLALCSSCFSLYYELVVGITSVPRLHVGREAQLGITVGCCCCLAGLGLGWPCCCCWLMCVVKELPLAIVFCVINCVLKLVFLFALICLTTFNVPRHNHSGLDLSIPPLFHRV